MKRIFVIFAFLFPAFLAGRQIETFYGSYEIDEPVLLEIIDSEAFQRLKKVHQYGVSYYTTHREEYTRYDHSLGVFVLLRRNNCSLKEQVAGLLHDVSHTAFSHVGDWVFGKEHQEKDYQNENHARYIEQSGLAQILHKYQIQVEEILPEEVLFKALECRLPDLSADRIDYNLQGAYWQGFLTYEEAITLFNDFQYVDDKWISHRADLLKKMCCFSLFMTVDCWGSAANHVASRALADAILRGVEIDLLTMEELHFGTDQVIWDKLIASLDCLIRDKMQVVLHPQEFFILTNEPSDLVVRCKFRGVDPFVAVESRPVRLSCLDKEFSVLFEKTRILLSQGWRLKFFSHPSDQIQR